MKREQYLELLEENEVRHLLDGSDGVGDAAGPDAVLEGIDFGFEWGIGEHRTFIKRLVFISEPIVFEFPDSVGTHFRIGRRRASCPMSNA